MSSSSTHGHSAGVVRCYLRDVTGLPHSIQRLIDHEPGTDKWEQSSRKFLEDILQRLMRTLLFGDTSLEDKTHLLPADEWNELVQTANSYRSKVKTTWHPSLTNLPRFERDPGVTPSFDQTYSFFIVLDHLYRLSELLCDRQYVERIFEVDSHTSLFSYDLNDYVKFKKETGWGKFARFLFASFSAYWHKHLPSMHQERFIKEVSSLYWIAERYGLDSGSVWRFLGNEYETARMRSRDSRVNDPFEFINEAFMLHLTNEPFPALEPISGRGETSQAQPSSSTSALRAPSASRRSASPLRRSRSRTREREERSLAHDDSKLDSRKRRIYGMQLGE